ncbi:immunoglobulin kappa light chain-like isoform X2 [Mobula birostris]|uniref:immunoglobulin kappa light chain-like isoform X2 n=1 Tax=Mobula birostris TaxID=1983395 RepID=UPI003B285BB1
MAAERLHRAAAEINPTPRSRSQRRRLPARVQMLMELLTLFVTIQMFRVCVAELRPFSESPSVVTAHVGKTVELSCELTDRVEVASNVFWYKQRAGEPLVTIKSTDCRKTGCRTAYKKGPGDHTSVLEIRDIRVEDAGSYHCFATDSYSTFVKGSTLLVGDSSTNRTYMLVFVLPSETNGSVPLVCLVGGLSSNQIVIYWNISGRTMEGWSDTGTLDPDKSYSVRSQVLIPVETWRSGGVCTCIAQLGGAGKTIINSVFNITIEPDQGWCLPTAILLGVLAFLVILIIIRISKERRSGTRGQLATHQIHGSAAQSQAPILYASLEFAASSLPRR